MIRNITLVFLAFVLFACKQSTPKETSAEFIEQLYLLDFEEAASLATAESKEYLWDIRKELQDNQLLKEEKAKRKEGDAEKYFNLGQLSESPSSDHVKVNNDVVSLDLKKVDDKWKVDVTKDLAADIVYRIKYIETANAALKNLKEEYERKNNLLADYISYKKSISNANPETNELEATIQSSKVDGELTGEKLNAYILKQDQISTQANKVVQPSFTANADLTLNYIIRLGRADDRIKQAKENYNLAAAKVRSKDYPVLK